jgi:2-phospho-L-lactate/phosphoenolpyruvate guanylyltransferase
MAMATAAILPIKRFADAKQRLQPVLGSGSRQALAAAMFADVLSTLGRSALVERLIVVTGERQVRDAVFDTDVVLVEEPTEKGQSPAALSGLARAAAAGFDRALLIPGDTPLIDPLELDNLLSNITVSAIDVAIVPDRHGTGTNALVLDPSGPFQPEFGPDSRERHEQQARRRGLRHSIETPSSLLLDVDTPEDLAELRRAFDEHRGRAPRTQGVMRQFERSRRSAISA